MRFSESCKLALNLMLFSSRSMHHIHFDVAPHLASSLQFEDGLIMWRYLVVDGIEMGLWQIHNFLNERQKFVIKLEFHCTSKMGQVFFVIAVIFVASLPLFCFSQLHIKLCPFHLMLEDVSQKLGETIQTRNIDIANTLYTIYTTIHRHNKNIKNKILFIHQN